MRKSIIVQLSSLLLVLLFATACTTSSKVLTVHPAGNYTSNVNPYGSSGR